MILNERFKLFLFTPSLITTLIGFKIEVILLAEKLVFIHNIKFFSSAELFPAEVADEALEVEDLVPGLPHQVRGGDAVQTAATPRPVQPAGGVRGFHC